jgi:hypothetical protein
MRYAALVATLLLGCGGNSAPPAEPAKKPVVPVNERERAACAAAIGEAARTGRAGEQFSPEDQKFSAEIEVVMTESCAATKWPEFVLMCLTHGQTREELNECTKMLTPAQRQDMMERVLVVTKAHEGAPKPAVKPVP